MYLKRLDIQGFKTFAERTQIVFTPGVTCVIGPNGSGKSNISDAISWVLGENNVRSLRGSSAQDVIFAGNEKRRPIGMAEVSLTIDNTARILPLDFSEITVTRRLYRSGESEFFINKVSCRLKDLYELFLDTGVGRDAYSLINQGEIDQILSVRAEDRRAIFEEAAGIKKYRVRKKEAERKLEHTQQNLLRVNDIVGEIEARLGPLQRQAAGATRYRELAGKLRVLENAWYGSRIRRLTTERESLAALVTDLRVERKRLDTELTAVQEEEKSARDSLLKLDERGEALRHEETAALQRVAAAEAEKARAEERAGEVERRLRAIARELDELAGKIEEQVRRSEATTREEAALKKEVDGLRSELGQAQVAAQEHTRSHELAVRELERIRQASMARARRQAELEARVQSFDSRLASLEQGKKRAGDALEDGEAELERLSIEKGSFLQAAEQQRERARALTTEWETLRDASRGAEQATTSARAAAEEATRAWNNRTARYQALSELGEKGEGAAAGARLLLTGVRRGQVPGRWSLLADGLSVPEGLEKAVEAALGVYADALLCDGADQANAALRWLRPQKAAALVLPGIPQGEQAPSPGSLGALVSPAGDDEQPVAWARHLLARVYVVEDLGDPDGLPDGAAPELWVTRDGQWRSAAGALSAGPLGAEGAAAAALARRREIERLKQELPELQSAAEKTREALRTAETELRRSQGTAREKQSESEKARLEHQSQLREAERRNGDVERARHRVERLKQEAARSEREHVAAVESLAQARAELAASTQQGANAAEDSEDALRQAQSAATQREEQRRRSDATVTDLRVRLAQQEQRLQGAVAASRRAVEGGSFLDRQRADRLHEQRTLVSEREQRQLSFGTLAQEVAEATATVARARQDQESVAAERADRTRAVNEARARGQDLGGRLRELMERTHRAEVELTALDTQRSHLGSQWMDAAAGAHNLELTEETDEEPLLLTVDGLLAAWNPAQAEEVLTSYSDPEAEIGRLRRQIRSLGAINPDAVEQYAEARERYEFLTTQRADLEAAREQLEGAIREIDAASRETFMRAFREIAAAFDVMFKKLFGGGTTELRLTDPDDILETGIDIIVQPPGKKQQNLLLLSGGERALTAAAMLFALLTVRPSPFCVMDEVDAPLDESNVGRFATTLREFSHRTQFIVVTHNRGTMEAADTLYGVTMAERGVSKVLSCTLSDPVVEQVAAEQKVAVAN